jgi:hypothetical protein
VNFKTKAPWSDGIGAQNKIDYQGGWCSMICPQCSGEMSKKWNPQRAAKVPAGSAVLWSCGVCGCQLTQAELKPSKDRQKSIDPLDSVPVASYDMP